MTLKTRLANFFKERVIERPAAKLSLDQHIERLRETGVSVAERLAGKGDSPRNRKQLAHIIGVERWGQSRLRTLAGEPFARDEYDGYRPSPMLDWNDLQAAFATTRVETVALACELRQRGVPPTATALHNSLGDLTLRGWLRYLANHASRESRLIR